jgi:hypothetical protein
MIENLIPFPVYTGEGDLLGIIIGELIFLLGISTVKMKGIPVLFIKVNKLLGPLKYSVAIDILFDTSLYMVIAKGVLCILYTLYESNMSVVFNVNILLYTLIVLSPIALPKTLISFPIGIKSISILTILG